MQTNRQSFCTRVHTHFANQFSHDSAQKAKWRNKSFWAQEISFDLFSSNWHELFFHKQCPKFPEKDFRVHLSSYFWNIWLAWRKWQRKTGNLLSENFRDIWKWTCANTDSKSGSDADFSWDFLSWAPFHLNLGCWSALPPPRFSHFTPFHAILKLLGSFSSTFWGCCFRISRH